VGSEFKGEIHLFQKYCAFFLIICVQVKKEKSLFFPSAATQDQQTPAPAETEF